MITEKESPPTKIAERDVLATRGLRLPQITLRSLRSCGIYCQPSISLEHQHLADRYVLRGVESGGAVSDLGSYCSFVGAEGQALCWLQRVDSIAVNGVHAIVIEPKMVRLQMLRVRHTYDLLITQHFLEQTPAPRRPALRSSILFYGRRGTLEMDLCRKDSGYIGTVLPVFFSRCGEPVEVPPMLGESVLKITAAVSCVGCRHSHLLQPGTSKIADTVAPEIAEVS
ncbi:MAG TPA: hypothetical protein VFA90_04180 [Terriglobales bacterium]|nr:hypothetical protein [Terriglobales bacterium]